jgi:hypothetical protein
MSIAGEIKKIARDVTKRARARVSSLQADLAEIEARMARVEAVLNTARLSPERLSNFQPQLGSKYQCPCCWIENEVQSSLRLIQSDAGGDLFRCDVCHFDHLAL